MADGPSVAGRAEIVITANLEDFADLETRILDKIGGAIKVPVVLDDSNVSSSGGPTGPHDADVPGATEINKREGGAGAGGAGAASYAAIGQAVRTAIQNALSEGPLMITVQIANAEKLKAEPGSAPAGSTPSTAADQPVRMVNDAPSSGSMSQELREFVAGNQKFRDAIINLHSRITELTGMHGQPISKIDPSESMPMARLAELMRPVASGGLGPNPDDWLRLVPGATPGSNPQAKGTLIELLKSLNVPKEAIVNFLSDAEVQKTLAPTVASNVGFDSSRPITQATKGYGIRDMMVQSGSPTYGPVAETAPAQPQDTKPLPPAENRPTPVVTAVAAQYPGSENRAMPTEQKRLSAKEIAELVGSSGLRMSGFDSRRFIVEPGANPKSQGGQPLTDQQADDFLAFNRERDRRGQNANSRAMSQGNISALKVKIGERDYDFTGVVAALARNNPVNFFKDLNRNGEIVQLEPEGIGPGGEILPGYTPEMIRKSQDALKTAHQNRRGFLRPDTVRERDFTEQPGEPEHYTEKDIVRKLVGATDMDVITGEIGRMTGDAATRDVLMAAIDSPQFRATLKLALTEARSRRGLSTGRSGERTAGNSTLGFGQRGMDASLRLGFVLQDLEQEQVNRRAEIDKLVAKIEANEQAGVPVDDKLYNDTDKKIQQYNRTAVQIRDLQEVAGSVKTMTPEEARTAEAVDKARGDFMRRMSVGGALPLGENGEMVYPPGLEGWFDEAYDEHHRGIGRFAPGAQGRRQRMSMLDFLGMAPTHPEERGQEERDAIEQDIYRTWATKEITDPVMQTFMSPRMGEFYPQGEVAKGMSERQMRGIAMRAAFEANPTVANVRKTLAQIPEDDREGQKIAREVDARLEELFGGLSGEVGFKILSANEYIDTMEGDVRRGRGSTVATRTGTASTVDTDRWSTRKEQEEKRRADLLASGEYPMTSLDMEVVKARGAAAAKLGKPGEPRAPIEKLRAADVDLAEASPSNAAARMAAYEKAKAAVDAINQPVKEAESARQSTRLQAKEMVDALVASGITDTNAVRENLAGRVGLSLDDVTRGDYKSKISSVADAVVREALEALQYATPDQLYVPVGGVRKEPEYQYDEQGRRQQVTRERELTDEEMAKDLVAGPDGTMRPRGIRSVVEPVMRDVSGPLVVSPRQRDRGLPVTTGTQNRQIFGELDNDTIQLGGPESRPSYQNALQQETDRQTFEAEYAARTAAREQAPEAPQIPAISQRVHAIDAELKTNAERRAQYEQAEQKAAAARAKADASGSARGRDPRVAGILAASRNTGFVPAPEPKTREYFETDIYNDWVLQQSRERFAKLQAAQKGGAPYTPPTDEERDTARHNFMRDELPKLVDEAMANAKPTEGLLQGPYDQPQAQSNHDWFEQMNYGPFLDQPGSKFHVSATGDEAQRTLEIVDTIARQMAVPYKFVRSRKALEGGLFGPQGDQRGKFITAYPTVDKQQEFAELIAQALEEEGLGANAPAPTGEIPYANGLPIYHRWVENASGGGYRHGENGGYNESEGRVPTILQRDAYTASQSSGPDPKLKAEADAAQARVDYLIANGGGPAVLDDQAARLQAERAKLMDEHEQAVRLAGIGLVGADGGRGRVPPGNRPTAAGGPPGGTDGAGGLTPHGGPVPVNVMNWEQMPGAGGAGGPGPQTYAEAAPGARAEAIGERARFRAFNNAGTAQFVQAEARRLMEKEGLDEKQVRSRFRPYPELAAHLDSVLSDSSQSARNTGSLNVIRRRGGLEPLPLRDSTTPESQEIDEEMAGFRARSSAAQRRILRRGFTASVTDILQAPFFEKQNQAVNAYNKEVGDLGKILAKQKDAIEDVKNAETTLVDLRSKGAKKGLIEAAEAAKALADQRKKALDEQEGKQRQIVAEKEGRLPGVGQAAVNLGIGGIAAAGAFGMGSIVYQAAGMILNAVTQGIAKVVGPQLERMAGDPNIRGTFATGAAEGAASSLGQFDRAQAAFVQKYNMSSQQGEYFAPLVQEGMREQGNIRLAELGGAMRALDSLGRDGMRGITRGTGGMWGTVLGQNASAAEIVAGMAQSWPGWTSEEQKADIFDSNGPMDMAYKQSQYGVTPTLSAMDIQTLPWRQTKFSLDQLASRTPEEQRMEWNQDNVIEWEKKSAEAARGLEILNSAAERGGVTLNKFGNDFSDVTDDMRMAQAKAVRDLGGEGAEALAKAIEDKKINIRDERGGLETNANRLNTLLGATASGTLKPDLASLITLNKKQMEAQWDVESAMGRMTRGTGEFEGMGILESKLGIGLAAQPMGTGTSGITGSALLPGESVNVAGGVEGIKADYAEIKKMQDEGVASAEAFVSKWLVGSEAVGEFKEALSGTGGVVDLGKQISDIQIGREVAHAAYAAEQFSFSIYVANRSLKDAKAYADALAGGSAGGLGGIQGAATRLQREAQGLQLGMSQLQINFQKNLAGFVTPGDTPEERAARIEQARLEAEYAQKQLDIQEKLFKLSGRALRITASRQVNDLTRQLALLEEGRQISLDDAAAQKKLRGLNKLMEKELAIVNNIFDEAQSRASGLLSLSGKFAGEVAEDVAGVFELIYKNYATYIGRFASILGGGGGGSGKKKAASGFVGTVRGETSMTVGEAGDETVAVLSSPRSVDPSSFGLGGGGMTVNIYVTGNTVSKERDLDELVYKIERMMNQKAALLGYRRHV